jgi:hypothetical protein
MTLIKLYDTLRAYKRLAHLAVRSESVLAAKPTASFVIGNSFGRRNLYGKAQDIAASLPQINTSSSDSLAL